MSPTNDPQADFLLCHRAYLALLARVRLPAWAQACFSQSDAVHQTLTNALAHREQLRAMHPNQVRAYLRTTLQNVVRDEFRKQRKRGRSLDEFIDRSTSMEMPIPVDPSTPSDKVIREELLVDLATALEQLPPRQSAAIELHYLKTPRLTLIEIAAQLGCTEKAAAGLLCRGLEKLRQILRQCQ